MYHLECLDEWNSIHPNDMWVYSKLFLNRLLGHLCGPTGVPVPYSGYYIVRPSINLLGMGRFSRIEWIDKETEQFHPSEFWCEIFEGEHISVDFRDKKAELIVVGERHDEKNLYKWKRWTKVNRNIQFPEILNNLHGDYEWINCEFIGDHLIEVHFRRNPDFRYNNTIAIPVWNEEEVKNIPNLTFIEDKEYLRKGFYIDSRDSNPVKSSDLINQELKNDQKS